MCSLKLPNMKHFRPTWPSPCQGSRPALGRHVSWQKVLSQGLTEGSVEGRRCWLNCMINIERHLRPAHLWISWFCYLCFYLKNSLRFKIKRWLYKNLYVVPVWMAYCENFPWFSTLTRTSILCFGKIQPTEHVGLIYVIYSWVSRLLDYCLKI